MMPENCRELADKAVDLIGKSSSFAGILNADVALAVGDLVRSMDCHYSNVIDGVDTRPEDIERALHADFDVSEDKQTLQKAAKAHIEVQALIDSGEAPDKIFSKAFILWIHREFYQRLPDTHAIVAGSFRQSSVRRGSLMAPEHGEINTLLTHFEQVYDPLLHSRVRQVIAVAASHHRFLWIHPFIDGNGLLTRLMSHACLKQFGLDSSLWSLSRGLAKRSAEYGRLLQTADKPHHNKLNGHSSLSERSLARFCESFLDSCIDQVDCMHHSLQPKELQIRIGRYCAFETEARNLLPGSWNLLREALLCGAFNRGKASELTGKGSVQARKVLARLIEKGLLVSDTPKGPVRLGLPLHVLDQWMPGLYQ